jgi:hypothetical protein
MFIPQAHPLRLFSAGVFFLAVLLVTSLRAQPDEGFTPVEMLKPRQSKAIYLFPQEVPGEIHLRSHKPDRSAYGAGEALGDAGRNALALVLGSMGSSREINWQLEAELRCSDRSLDWQIRLFCPGVLEKDSESVRNEDGSRSVQTVKTAFLDWHREATGLILERGDTIGRFIIVMNPRQNPVFGARAEEVYAEQRSESVAAQNNRWFEVPANVPTADFGIIGVLRGERFTLLNNGNVRKIWLYSGDRHLGFFFPDLDDNPFLRKKDRIQPRLLLAPDLPAEERSDWIRMALAGHQLSLLVSRNEFRIVAVLQIRDHTAGPFMLP